MDKNLVNWQIPTEEYSIYKKHISLDNLKELIGKITSYENTLIESVLVEDVIGNTVTPLVNDNVQLGCKYLIWTHVFEYPKEEKVRKISNEEIPLTCPIESLVSIRIDLVYQKFNSSFFNNTNQISKAEVRLYCNCNRELYWMGKVFKEGETLNGDPVIILSGELNNKTKKFTCKEIFAADTNQYLV